MYIFSLEHFFSVSIHFTCKGPKLESESLYLYSCVISPQPRFKLLCQPRASTRGVKIASSQETFHNQLITYNESVSYLQRIHTIRSIIQGSLGSRIVYMLDITLLISSKGCVFRPAFRCTPVVCFDPFLGACHS